MSDYILVHHGIKGQKWGVRRFQNSDGSLTDAGERRYNGGATQGIRRKVSGAALRRDNDGSTSALRRARYKMSATMYDAHAKAYNKIGTKSAKRMAGVSQKAADYSREKLKEANVANVHNKYNKKLAKSQKYDANVMNARSKNRERYINRMDNKISKAESKGKSAEKIERLKNKQSETVKSFDQATKHIKSGQAAYNSVIANKRNVTLKALDDKTFKKDPEYKKAVYAYTNQVVSDLAYGSAWTKLVYASDAAKKSKGK